MSRVGCVLCECPILNLGLNLLCSCIAFFIFLRPIAGNHDLELAKNCIMGFPEWFSQKVPWLEFYLPCVHSLIMGRTVQGSDSHRHKLVMSCTNQTPFLLTGRILKSSQDWFLHMKCHGCHNGLYKHSNIELFHICTWIWSALSYVLTRGNFTVFCRILIYTAFPGLLQLHPLHQHHYAYLHHSLSKVI